MGRDYATLAAPRRVVTPKIQALADQITIQLAAYFHHRAMASNG